MLVRRGAGYPKAARCTGIRKMIEKEKLDGVVMAVSGALGPARLEPARDRPPGVRRGPPGDLLTEKPGV